MEFPSFLSRPLDQEDFLDFVDEIHVVEKEVEVQNEEEEIEDKSCWATYGKRKPRRKLPPPIPLLARTGKLSSRMPWVMNRSYEADGRLVIRQVPVKRHEYFHTVRENGRLVLKRMELEMYRYKKVFGDIVFKASLECKEESEEKMATICQMHEMKV